MGCGAGEDREAVGEEGVAEADVAAAGAEAGDATESEAAMTAVEGSYSKTSWAMIRPPGPVPTIRRAEMSPYPICLARVCARGEATTRSPVDDGAGDGAKEGGGVGAAGAAGASTAGAGAGAADAAAAPTSATKSLNAATLPSSSTVTIMGVPQAISPGPASAIILATMPSSCASKSTVALSVSTEQRTSPAPKESPSETFQEEMLPDSMVGEREGMPTTSWGG
mmetsp:Transcript_4682/g.10047  ORF Transcript_4682/g.10047 Transcript_4682/m.10047 type:complete len:224 (-) Transcript_4682:232-903(-)